MVPAAIRLEFAGYETVGHPGFISKLLERARQRCMGERVKYLGCLQRAESLNACRRAHVGLALLPGQSDDCNERTMTGASNKPFDYMACGLALLVSDLHDWNEMFVGRGYGHACDPADPTNIAAAMQWFFEHRDENRVMGERGRQRVLNGWNYEAQFEPVLQSVESM
jgi:spore maturation protein CgeB